MAAATVIAKLAVMNVVSSMAIRAATAEFRHGRERLPVATVTGHRYVRTIEQEVSLCVVVK